MKFLFLVLSNMLIITLIRLNLIGILYICIYHSKKITFKANQILYRHITKENLIKVNNNLNNIYLDANEEDETNRFSVWFSQKEMPLIILTSNPGIIDIKKLDNQLFKAYLSPLQFPG